MGVMYVIAGVLSVVLLLLYLASKRFKKPNVKMLLLIPALVFGFDLYLAGYLPALIHLQDNTAPVSFGDALDAVIRAAISTVKMLAGKDEFSAVKGNDEYFTTLAYMIPFWAAHLLALAVTIMAAVTVFGRSIMARLRRLRYLGSDTYIIYGTSSGALALGQNIMAPDGCGTRAKNRFVIFIGEETGAAAKEKIAKMGAVVLKEPIFDCGALNNDALLKAGFNSCFKRRLYLFAMTGSDRTNFKVAAGIWDAAVTYDIPEDRLKGIWVNTVSSAIVGELEARKQNLDTRYWYNINYFSETELAARSLFSLKPIYRQLEFVPETGLPKCRQWQQKPSVTVFILGFGELGRRVFEKALTSGQFENCAFRAVIIDKNLNAVMGDIKNDYPALFDPDLPDDITLELIPADIGSSVFYDRLKASVHEKERACDIAYIVAALGDDDLNFEAINKIKSILIKHSVEKLPVLAIRAADKSFGAFGADGTITTFGCFEEIYTHDIVVNEKLDIFARAVHAAYDQKNAQPWPTLSLHLKNSNRAAADYIPAYLSILGLKLTGDKNDSMTREEFDKLISCEPLMENLGRTEHRRWNAFHYAAGWTKKPLPEVTDWASRKDDKSRRQACLLSWEELRKLDRIADMQALDKDNVRRIYSFLETYNTIAPGLELYISKKSKTE